MALSASTIQKLYVAFFNRPADPAGLSFWTAQGDLDAVGKAMAGSAEYIAAHAGMSNTAVITSFYQNLFGRTPDAGGLAFWVDALDRGVLKPGSLALLMIQVTQGTDGAALNNKALVASSFTAALDTPAEQAIFASNPGASVVKALLNSVGADSNSLVTAQGNVDPTILSLFPVITPVPPTIGAQTFTLTAANDNFTGAAADDSFNGMVNIGGVTSYNTGDVLDGGGGTDTLSVDANSNFTLNGANLSNIERLKVRAETTLAVLFDGVSGITELVNDNSPAWLTFGLSGKGVGQIVDLIIDGGTGATALGYDDAVLAGLNDKMTVRLNDTGATSRQLIIGTLSALANQLETLTINAAGINAMTLQTGSAQTSLKTLNITGSGSLALEFQNAGTRTSVTTIDASTATGNVTLGNSIGTVDATPRSFTLGSGNDTVFMGSNLGSAYTLDGGTGTDTLVVNRQIVVSDLSHVTSFEVVRFDMTSALVQDTSFAALSGVNYEVQSTQFLALTGLANNTTVTVTGSIPALSLALATNTAADSLTVKLTGAGTLSTINGVTDLDTLNIVSSGGANTISSDGVLAKHVITGDRALTINGFVMATNIDASGLSGDLTLRMFAASTVIGGSGNDKITGSTGADTLNGGAGNDAIWLGAQGANATSGADTITLGTGNDTVVFVGNSAGGDGAATSYAGFAQITDFIVGASGATDLLRFSASNADFSLNGSAGLTTGLAKGAVAQGLTAGDAMVVQQLAGGSGSATLTTGVSLFKLTDIVAFTGDIKTTFQTALGSTAITDLAANGNYLLSIYDTSAEKMVIGVVNVGGDGIFNATDITNTGIAMVGVVIMTAADYALLGDTQLGVAA